MFGLYRQTQFEFGHYHKDKMLSSSVIDFDNKIQIVDINVREIQIFFHCMHLNLEYPRYET